MTKGLDIAKGIADAVIQKRETGESINAAAEAASIPAGDGYTKEDIVEALEEEDRAASATPSLDPSRR